MVENINYIFIQIISLLQTSDYDYFYEDYKNETDVYNFKKLNIDWKVITISKLSFFQNYITE